MDVEAASEDADGPPPAEPKALVRALLTAFTDGDEAAIRTLLHPDVEFVPMLVATGERPEPYRGHDGLIDYLRDTRALLLDIQIDVLDVHTDGDIVVALARVHGTARGGVLDAATTYVFRIRDHLVIHGIVGSDPDRARRAFGLDERDEGTVAGRWPALAPLELHLAAEAESVPTIRRAVDAYAGALGASDALRGDVRLAVSEACSNAVLHAYLDLPAERQPGWLTVRVWRAADVLHVTVADEGRGMIARVDSPGLGMGLVVMSRVASVCTITTQPEREAGCLIHLEFAVRPAERAAAA